jgi:hypothetical protein
MAWRVRRAVGKAAVRGNALGGAVQFLETRENRGLVLEALVADELQGGVDLLSRLDAGEPLLATLRWHRRCSTARTRLGRSGA